MLPMVWPGTEESWTNQVFSLRNLLRMTMLLAMRGERKSWRESGGLGDQQIEAKEKKQQL